MDCQYCKNGADKTTTFSVQYTRNDKTIIRVFDEHTCQECFDDPEYQRIIFENEGVVKDIEEDK